MIKRTAAIKVAMKEKMKTLVLTYISPYGKYIKMSPVPMILMLSAILKYFKDYIILQFYKITK